MKSERDSLREQVGIIAPRARMDVTVLSPLPVIKLICKYGCWYLFASNWQVSAYEEAVKSASDHHRAQELSLQQQMDAMIDGCPKYHGRFSTKDPDGKLNYYELIRAIEAAHGIKE